MTSLLVSLLLNLLVASLLSVTIFYCWRLNQRIRILQDSRSEMAHLIQQFDESTERASASIIAIQAASKKIAENIQNKLDKANYLADDLSFMIEKGSKLADQMEARISTSRQRSTESDRGMLPPRNSAPPPRPASTMSPPAQPAPSKTSLRDKLTATGASQSKPTTSLESVLERIAGRNTPPAADSSMSARKPAAAPTQAAVTARMRSKAEQELLEALKGTH